MQTRYLYVLRFVLTLSDLLLIIICFFISYHVCNKNHFITPQIFFTDNFVTVSAIWLFCAFVYSLYAEGTIYKLEKIYRATFKTLLLHLVIFISYTLVVHHGLLNYKFFLIFYATLISSFLLSRFIGTAFENILTRNFNIRKSIAVLGKNEGGIRLAEYLEKQSSVNFLGFLNDDEGLHVDSNGDLLLGTAVQLQKAAQLGVKEVFVSLTPDRMGEVNSLLREAEKHCIRLKFVPDLNSSSAVTFNTEHMGGFSVLSVRKEPLELMENRFKKRLFDVLFSSFVIVFILSWLYPLIALIIKIDSKGPILFKQERSGRNNDPFLCFKFRSMYSNKEGHKQASRNDSRITKVGRFLRKTSLDEFPQFFNVFLGHMSICGPRPHMLDHTEQYRAIIDQYMVRQFLKPGITGWAQVKGFRGETKDPSLMEKRVEHDIWYMEHWSAMLDLRIVFMTILNALRGEENAF
jgi:putative colanic acid biosysnthesis UDP-glucose lipid carrier transferase